MVFDDPVLVKPGFLELPIDVTREDEEAIRHPARDLLEDLKCGTGFRFPVHQKTVSVETPGDSWSIAKRLWARDVLKMDSLTTEGRIGVPDTFLTPEIGQAGVDAEPGAGSDQKPVGLLDQFSTSGEALVEVALALFRKAPKLHAPSPCHVFASSMSIRIAYKKSSTYRRRLSWTGIDNREGLATLRPPRQPLQGHCCSRPWD